MLKRPAVGANSRIAMINKRFREEEETTAPSPPPSTPRSIDKFVHSKRDELQNTHTHKRDRREIARRTRIGSLPHGVSKHGNEWRLPISGIPTQPEESLLACLLAAARKRRNWTQECDPNASIIARQKDLISTCDCASSSWRDAAHRERKDLSNVFCDDGEACFPSPPILLLCRGSLSLTLGLELLLAGRRNKRKCVKRKEGKRVLFFCLFVVGEDDYRLLLMVPGGGSGGNGRRFPGFPAPSTVCILFFSPPFPRPTDRPRRTCTLASVPQ